MVPDELADRLRARQDRISEILELGLRDLDAEDDNGFVGAAEVLEFLAQLPTPEQMLDLRPSEAFERRINDLLQKNRDQGLSTTEEMEWGRYQYVEHLVRVAKTKALQRLKTQPADV
jgi:hypothetical protein